MGNSNNPLCPFCEPNEDCFRHKPKGIKEKKKPVPIKKVGDKKKSKESEEKERKKRLTEFYNECLNRMPHCCQESGEPLFESTIINPRTVCCHILDKSKFPSVECNFDNIIYMTAHNHNRYDMQRERFMKDAKIAPLIKERVKLLIPLLTPDEVRKIPEFLL